jgi:hypothetical protein
MTFDVITAARARSRRRFGLLAMLALGGVAVVCVAGRYATMPPGAAPASTVAAPVTSVTGQPAGLLPGDVTWIRLAGVALPVSPTSGPRQQAKGTVSGFAHTLSGAVIAGLHLLVRTTAQVGPAVFGPAIQSQVVGPDAAALRGRVQAEYAAAAARLGVVYGQPLGDLPARLAGLRVESQEPDRVVLGVLTSAPDRTGVVRYAATPVSLVWVRGDWRLLAPPGGSWDSLVRLVDPASVGDYPSLGRG